MKENGWIIKLKEKEHFGMQKVMYTLVILKLIKQMDMVFTRMLMVQGMKGSGLMMFKKDREKRHGLMEPSMSVNIKTVKNMDMVSTNGLTVASSKETGKKIKSLGMAYIIGKMVEFTKDIGTKIICMDQVYISGQTEDNMKVITSMIRKMVMVSTLTPMADAIKEHGGMANKMVKVYLLAQKEYLAKANGQMAKEITGWMKSILNIRKETIGKADIMDVMMACDNTWAENNFTTILISK